MIQLSPFVLLSLPPTIFLVPSTTGEDNKPSTLEVLAGEDIPVENLMKRMLNPKPGRLRLRGRNHEGPGEED
ncbi:uncharacterized protein K444DRAFT_172850 [Hyaloscypha bicolor E]|uniref:Uncharacterized protein n=1 Tax=Hyaloscypha bicolor E TaxID=1095630 RepID=A0A2J6SRB1_9HELO|nr:uncharacterized protein K444DRAFT_172850 [Hyaloscypha bicolor E]PMD53316.1 hypothetical protein K444DRAFT_172850 [Hyaloscypha bicolor E]